jgi:hypothetical protein
VRPLASGEPDAIDPHGLDLSFRATRGHRELAGRGGCRSNRRTALILLSWPYPLTPPRRAPAGASTPGRPQPKLLSAIGSGFPIPTSCSVRVVSHHLDGFLRTRAVGLLRPTPGLEVHCVSADRDPRSPRTEVRDTVGGQPPSPQCGCHPSKGYPRQQPCRITAAFAFLPLPSLGFPEGKGASPDHHCW